MDLFMTENLCSILNSKCSNFKKSCVFYKPLYVIHLLNIKRYVQSWMYVDVRLSNAHVNSTLQGNEEATYHYNIFYLCWWKFLLLCKLNESYSYGYFQHQIAVLDSNPNVWSVKDHHKKYYQNDMTLYRKDI